MRVQRLVDGRATCRCQWWPRSCRPRLGPVRRLGWHRATPRHLCAPGGLRGVCIRAHSPVWSLAAGQIGGTSCWRSR